MTIPNNMMDPYQILNIEAKGASDDQIHQAYLKAVRQFPPDKNPEQFQQIRDAYEMIKTQENRLKINLFGIESIQPLSEILPDGAKRSRVGVELWISMIEAEAKRMREFEK